MRDSSQPFILVESRGGIWIGANFISGFIDEDVCQTCRSNRIYDDVHDSYLCPRCNAWLEDTCSEIACVYCSERPSKPLLDSDAITSDTYIKALLALWPTSEHDTSAAAAAIADDAVAAHPRCAQLWCMRGDLIQLAPLESGYDLEDALRSYAHAAQIGPALPEAWESIGYFHHVHTGDLLQAEVAFKRAVDLGAGPDAWIGLARVIAQRTGQAESALAMLDRSPYAQHERVQEIRAEISAGNWS